MAETWLWRSEDVWWLGWLVIEMLPTLKRPWLDQNIDKVCICLSFSLYFLHERVFLNLMLDGGRRLETDSFLLTRPPQDKIRLRRNVFNFLLIYLKYRMRLRLFGGKGGVGGIGQELVWSLSKVSRRTFQLYWLNQNLFYEFTKKVWRHE